MVQERIRQYRARLLGGTGPDASPTQLASSMHQRPVLGVTPTATEREQVHQQTIRARGDDPRPAQLFSTEAGGATDQPNNVAADRDPAGPKQSAGTALQLLRATYGGVQLARPALLADRLLGVPPDRRTRWVARLLGARQLGQAALSGLRPSPRALAIGAAVDLAHAVSMLALGAVDRRRRRAAATDALVAGGFALAGVLAARAVADRDEP